jgi:anti-anti-sigma factor
LKNKKATPSIAIEGELTIFTAAELKQRLIAALTTGSIEVEVDLSQVSEIDSAGIQLMVAAKREASARNLALRFTSHSSAVFNLIELYDLSGYFGDPVWIHHEA